MSTTIRPELSPNNEEYLHKYRYYELKYLCLQYPDWKKKSEYLGNEVTLTGTFNRVAGERSEAADPVFNLVAKKMYYDRLIDLVESAAKEADPELKDYILAAVTRGHSYNFLKNILGIPCCKEGYYKSYHHFFYILSKKERKMNGGR